LKRPCDVWGFYNQYSKVTQISVYYTISHLGLTYYKYNMFDTHTDDCDDVCVVTFVWLISISSNLQINKHSITLLGRVLYCSHEQIDLVP